MENYKGPSFSINERVTYDGETCIVIGFGKYDGDYNLLPTNGDVLNEKYLNVSYMKIKKYGM